MEAATSIQNDDAKEEAKKNSASNPCQDQPMAMNTDRILSVSMVDNAKVDEMIRIDAEHVKILPTEQSVSSGIDPDHDGRHDSHSDEHVRMPVPVALLSGSGSPTPSTSPVTAPPDTIYNPKHKWNKLIRNPLFFGRLFVLILSLILLSLSIAYCIGQLLTVGLDLVRKCTPKTREKIWAHSYQMSQKKEYYDTDGTFIMNEESQWGHTMEDCWTTKEIDISTDRVWHQNQFYPQKIDFDQMAPMSFTIAVLFGFNALFCVIVIVYNLITIIVDIMWLSRHQLHTKSEYFSTTTNKYKGTNERAFARIKDMYRTYFDDDKTGWIILHIVGELLEFFIQTSALLLYGGYNMWDPHHSNDIYLANKPEFIIVFAVILSFNLS
eukprot:169637_1